MIIAAIVLACVIFWTLTCLLTDKNGCSFIICLLPAIAFTVAWFAMGCRLLASRLTVDIDTQSLIQREQSLRWQAESGAYKYDDIARKLLADNVTEWNAELAENKARKDNIWVSVFYPIDYDQFDYIPIELLEGHEE